MTLEDLKQRYERVLDRLVALAEADPTLIGVYVCGSSVRGDFWERSDIDLSLITSDESRACRSFSLVEDGIEVNTQVYSRSRFLAIHGSALRGSVQHHIFTSGRLLFTKDPTLHDCLAAAQMVGQRDRELVIMHTAMGLYGCLYMVEKELVAHADPISAFQWLCHALDRQAEVLLLEDGGELRLNARALAVASSPPFAELCRVVFEARGKPDAILEICHRLFAELRERAHHLYKPLFDYLTEEREIRTASQIHRAVGERLGFEGPAHGVGCICTWLARVGLIRQTTLPVRITRRAQVEFEEAAYFLGGDRP